MGTQIGTERTIGIGSGNNWGLNFNCTQAFNLSKVSILPQASTPTEGTVTIGLINNAGTILQRATFDVIGTPQTVGNIIPTELDLNFEIPAGNGYKLVLLEFTGIAGLVYSGSTGTYNYGYSLSGVVNISSSTNNTSNTANNVYMYFYNWVVGLNNCESARVPVTATIHNLPTINLGNDTMLCANQEIKLDIPDTTFQIVWSTGDTSRSLIVTNADTIFVKVTDTNNCTNADTIIIREGVEPINNLIATSSFCEGDSLILDAGNPNSSFTWNTNETSQTIVVKNSDTYTVSITTSDYCTKTFSTNVTVNPNPEITLNDDTSICVDIPIIIKADNGGNTYLWNNGLTSNEISVIDDGIYSVLVTNQFNCTSRDSINIIRLPKPYGEGFGFRPIFDNLLTTLVYNAISLSDYDSLVWNFGDSSYAYNVENITHTYPQKGVYDVTLTLYNDCGITEFKQKINVADLGTSLSDIDTDNQLIIYPNPAQDHITIISQDKMISKLEIYNILGSRIIVHEKTAKEIDINTNMLTNGIYSLIIYIDNKVINKKIEILK